MKSLKIERLLASSALALALMLVSHPAPAQQADQQDQAVVPLPDYPVPQAAAKESNAPAQAASTDATRDVAKDAAKDSKPDASSAAAEPAKAAAIPAATPVEADADNAIADKLHDIITGKQFDRVVSHKADRDGVEQFYKARDYKPLWVSHGSANERAQAAIAYLAQVDSVGLDPRDYAAPDFKAATTPDALATAEIKFTNSVLTYARQAQIGRIHFSRIGADIQFDLVPPVPEKVLARTRRRERRCRGARQLQSATAGIPGVARKARRTAQRSGGCAAGRKAEGAGAYRRREDLASRHERRARGRAAQAPGYFRRQG